MKKYFINIICCSFLLSTPILASTQSTQEAMVTEAETEQKVAEQYVSKEELSNQIYAEVMGKIQKTIPTLSGYIQTGYVWNDKNAGNTSTFQMKRMRLILDKKISNMFDVKAQFEVFSGSTDGNTGKRVMTIMDAYANTHFSKAVNFRVGQYFLPLGFENYDLGPASLETVDFSNINLRMVCRNAVSSPNLIDYGRDVGLMMYGDLFRNVEKKFDYLSYQLSVTNGNLPTITDNNKSKDIVGRITVRPIDKLRLMASYNWGEYNKFDNTATINKKNNSLNRFITGAWYYDPNGLSLRSEYGHLESKDANIKEDGLYILAAYKVNKFLPVARWDMFRDKKNETTLHNRDAFLLGCTYEPIKDIKIQLAYTHLMYTDKAKKANDKSNGNNLQIMCLAKF